MKTIRIRTHVAAFLIAIVFVLQISPRLAAGEPKTVAEKHHRQSIEVTFTKWVNGWPNLAGLVSGDVGGGLLTGEVVNFEQTDGIDRIEALYHLKGSAGQFTARVFVVQNPLKGTATFKGVVTDGALKGKRVRGEYQIISPCGIINADGDVCFQGTLTVGPDED